MSPDERAKAPVVVPRFKQGTAALLFWCMVCVCVHESLAQEC